MISELGVPLVFPDPSEANEEGLLAYGGDLSAERLLLAYSQGIFPWPHEDYPLLWFSPDPRTVLLPRDFNLPRSLKKVINKGVFEIRFDTAFESVMRACAEVKRKEGEGTWINTAMLTAYTRLHRLGFAHSVETWRDDVLVGGLYGLSLGAAFFGESMFMLCDNASKVAVVALLQQLKKWDFSFIDCQMHTAHMARFGTVDWPRATFLSELKQALRVPTRCGMWVAE